MWFTRVSLKNPVFATMLMLALVVLGAFSYQRLKVDQFPNIDFPTVVVTMDYPGASKPIPVLQEPVMLSRTPLTIRSRAPKLGEHTDQILQELGYGPAAIEKLRADRVV